MRRLVVLACLLLVMGSPDRAAAAPKSAAPAIPRLTIYMLSYPGTTDAPYLRTMVRARVDELEKRVSFHMGGVPYSARIKIVPEADEVLSEDLPAQKWNSAKDALAIMWGRVDLDVKTGQRRMSGQNSIYIGSFGGAPLDACAWRFTTDFRNTKDMSSLVTGYALMLALEKSRADPGVIKALGRALDRLAEELLIERYEPTDVRKVRQAIRLVANRQVTADAKAKLNGNPVAAKTAPPRKSPMQDRLATKGRTT